ncbi:MAG: DUF6259 domain-containing protein, partial [Kiritimatiellae bacterium]|nr:DUF6259 domain-containing protein [Kiritimatiellia bacterium]
TRAAVSTATVTFQPLDPIMARSWASIQSNPSIPTGLLAYSYSKDGGATWTGLKDAALDAVGTGATVTLRCTVKPDAGGKSSPIAAWSVVAKELGEPLIQLANAEQRILFDPATGDLMGWWSAQDGWFVPPGRRQPLFELGMPDGVAKPVAGSLQRRACETPHAHGATLALEYLLEGGSLTARVNIALPEKGLARWKLRVENGSAREVYGLSFPMISGVRIGSDAEANRAPAIDAMASDCSGVLYHSPMRGNPTSGLYPGWTSMGWYTLYSPESAGAFTIQTRNKDAYHIWMTYNNDPAAMGLDYKFSRMLVVDPEGTGEAEYEIGWHAGDWHRSADLYRQWARTWMKKVDNPEWVRRTDGWTILSEGVADRYITHAWPNLDWFGVSYSQNFGRTADGTPSFSPFPCLNPRLGTVEDFRRAHAEARKRGWHNTYYYNQAWSDSFLTAPYMGPTPRRLIPKELRLQPLGFTAQWGRLNPDGSVPRYSFTDIMNYGPTWSMCGSGWAQALADNMAYNFGAVYGADGVYFDQAALGGGFCFSLNHGHGSQRAIGMQTTIEGMRRAIEEGRKRNPDYAMATEGNNDQCMQYANFGLWVGHLGSEGDVFKYTFPEVQLIKGHINGATRAGFDVGDYARHLNLFLVADFVSASHDVKEFYAHRKRIGDWMHEGEFQDTEGLTLGKPGIDTRWFRRADGKHVGAAINIHNEDRVQGAELRLKWDALATVSKAFAYLWGGEVKALPVRWDNGATVVEVPDAQASTILLVAKAPKDEAVRAHCYWPLAPGPDKLVLELVNTSDKARTVKLSWNPPEGVALKAPPERCEVAAGGTARVEVGLDGIGNMTKRGRVEVRVSAGFSTRCAASCILAPPLVNGGFETDSMGNGTPDMWSAKGSEPFTMVMQQKEPPASVKDANEVLHHIDGLVDGNAPAEGKQSMQLPGRLMLPNYWVAPGTAIVDQPYYFKTSQPTILKRGTRYVLTLMHRHEADDGVLELSSDVGGWFPDVPAFPPQKMSAIKGERGWQPYRLEFTTSDTLSGVIELQFLNKSTGKVWVDNVEIREVSGGQK